MILENALQSHGYARILLASYHSDGPSISDEGLQGFTIVNSPWNSNLVFIHEDLVGKPSTMEDDSAVAHIFDSLFPGLRTRMFQGKPYADYNDAPEQLHDMNIIYVQADSQNLLAMWNKWGSEVGEGPQGADDDTFDYWPSAFGAWMQFGYDLKDLDLLTEEELLARARMEWEHAAAQREGQDKEYFESEVTPCP